MTGSNTASAMSVYRSSYPDPFLDVASTKLPKSRKKLLELCWFFGTQHAQISPIIKKLAKYPITNIVVNAANNQASLEKEWKNFFEKTLDIYELAEKIGLNYFGYGNVFIIRHRPFMRVYTCSHCKQEYGPQELDYYIRDKYFVANCKKGCKKSIKFSARDDYLTTPDLINIVILDPVHMTVKKNSLTGTKKFIYSIPSDVSRAINGSKPDREFIDETPLKYIEAAIQKKKIRFNNQSLLHLEEPTMEGGGFKGWGLPIIIASLRDAYLHQIYKKADETMANERTVPARFIYPQSGANDPLRTISLKKWADFMRRTMQRWRVDKNAIMPVPFAVGTAVIGGETQPLNTLPMRQATLKEVIGGTGVPEGFLADSMSWSGGSIQLKMLENSIMGYLRALDRVLEFIVKETRKVTKLGHVDVKFKPFSKSDDMQLLQLLIQLAGMNKVSWKEVHERIELVWEDQKEDILDDIKFENKIRVEQAVAEAKSMLESVAIQAETQFREEDARSLREQINENSIATSSRLNDNSMPFQQHKETVEKEKGEMEQAANEPNEMEQAKIDKLRAEADEATGKNTAISSYIEKLSGMPPEKQERFLAELREQAPKIAERVEAGLKKQTEDPVGNVLEQLRASSPSPQAMANKILMLQPRMRKELLSRINKDDPALAMRVINALTQATGGGRSKPKTVVDMRPQPQQKPPRRK